MLMLNSWDNVVQRVRTALPPAKQLVLVFNGWARFNEETMNYAVTHVALLLINLRQRNS